MSVTTIGSFRSLRAPDATLEPWPLSSDQVVSGDPQASGAVLWLSEDKRLGNGVWECTPGTFTWDYTWDETMYLIEGEGTVTDGSGATTTVAAGDLFFVPTGTTTTWVVSSTVRKAFHFRSETPVPL